MTIGADQFSTFLCQENVSQGSENPTMVAVRSWLPRPFDINQSDIIKGIYKTLTKIAKNIL